MTIPPPKYPAPLLENEAALLAPNAQAGWLETPTGRVRFATWPASDPATTRGTIVLAHGLSEQIEKYQPAIRNLCERGFAVAMMDWRGHGLSDNCPPKAKENFSVRDEDLALFMRVIVTKHFPKPYIGMGHSFGGCLMCCAVHDHPDWFAGGVLCSPMLGIRVLTRHPILKLLCRILAPFMSHQNRKAAKKQSRYTSDVERFRIHQKLLNENPQLLPKFHFYNWVNSAVKRLRIMHAPGWYEAIKVPMLVFAAGEERLVHNDATHYAVAHMQQAEIVEINTAWHEILMEQEHIQGHMWKELDEFLDQLAPPTVIKKAA